MASAIQEGADTGPSATRGALVLGMIGKNLVPAEQCCGNERAALDRAFEIARARRGMLARDVQLFFTHDHGCAMAQVTRDARGRFGTAQERAGIAGALNMPMTGVAG